MPKIFKKKLRGSVLFLKSPTPKSGRATFAIIERKNGKNKTLYPDQLRTINEKFKLGQLNYDQARLLAEEVLEKITPKQAVVHNQANLKLVEDYWEKDYGSRDLVDASSAKNRLLRAAEAVGTLSILIATRNDLQDQVDRRFKGNRQRDIVAALNQLLKFAGRDIRLRKSREEIKRIRKITVDELYRILPYIKDEKLRLMHEVAFGTGLRAGELFGITEENLKKEHLEFDTQIDVDGIRRHTKNRKSRSAYILQKFRPAVKEWVAIPLSDRLKFRKRSIAKITREASKKALDREITFHDLRHSYAVYLISKNVSLSLVAQSLGDSIRVAERYYVGFAPEPESIAQISALERRGK